MRKYLLSVLLLFFSATIFSQQDSVLRNFKFRINKFRAINISAGSGGNTEDLKHSTGKSTSHFISGFAGADYYELKSTDRIYRTFLASTGTNSGSSKYKGPLSEGRGSNISGSSLVSLSNTWFNKNFFAMLGGNLTGSLARGKNKSIDPTINTYRFANNNYSASLEAGIGTGRLENVRDMQNALWLYKTLQEEGKLTRSLSDTELHELGRTVTTANNTRILDARRRTRFILKTVDQFFKDKNLISENDIDYFSALNDILFFAINNGRFSGTQLFARINPAIYHYDTDNSNTLPSTKNESNGRTKVFRAEVGISRHKPINLKHQDNFGATALFEYFDNEQSQYSFINGIPTSSAETQTEVKKAGVRLFYEHAIYPNTRTMVSLGIETETGYQDNAVVTGNFYSSILASGTLNYFISFRTMLTGGLHVIYRKNIYDGYINPQLRPEGIQAGLNIGLQVGL